MTAAETEVRPSLMIDLSLHNPRSCLTADDVEALNVLYPDCEGGMLEPVCEKPALNLGWLRMFLYIQGPALFALGLAALAHHLAARQLGISQLPKIDRASLAQSWSDLRAGKLSQSWSRGRRARTACTPPTADAYDEPPVDPFPVNANR